MSLQSDACPGGLRAAGYEPLLTSDLTQEQCVDRAIAQAKAGHWSLAGAALRCVERSTIFTTAVHNGWYWHAPNFP